MKIKNIFHLFIRQNNFENFNHHFLLKTEVTWNATNQNAAAAAATKSHQSCPILCDPIDGSPPGSSIHGISQARVLEWGAMAFSDKSE